MRSTTTIIAILLQCLATFKTSRIVMGRWPRSLEIIYSGRGSVRLRFPSLGQEGHGQHVPTEPDSHRRKMLHTYNFGQELHLSWCGHPATITRALFSSMTTANSLLLAVPSHLSRLGGSGK